MAHEPLVGLILHGNPRRVAEGRIAFTEPNQRVSINQQSHHM